MAEARPHTRILGCARVVEWCRRHPFEIAVRLDGDLAAQPHFGSSPRRGCRCRSRWWRRTLLIVRPESASSRLPRITYSPFSSICLSAAGSRARLLDLARRQRGPPSRRRNLIGVTERRDQEAEGRQRPQRHQNEQSADGRPTRPSGKPAACGFTLAGAGMAMSTVVSVIRPAPPSPACDGCSRSSPAERRS